MIKICIINSFPIVNYGLDFLLWNTQDMRLAGMASDLDTGIRLLRNCSCDMLLLDFALPEKERDEILDFIKKEKPDCLISFLDYRRERERKREKEREREREKEVEHTIIQMSAEPRVILDCIRELYRQKSDVDKPGSNRPDKNSFTRNHRLSVRESELLYLIVSGYTNREIAGKLFLSIETIHGYRKNLLLKMGVKNTASLVCMALTKKLVSIGE